MSGGPPGAPPLVSEVSRPWWNALARNEVSVQHCAACTHWVFYPRHFCPCCGSRDLAWQMVNGAATLYTWSIARVPVAPAFAHLGQTILAVAELDIGIRVPTSLINPAPGDPRAEPLRIGMRLSPVFDHDTYPDVTLLRYRPA